MAKRVDRFCWGIWLEKSGRWQSLPPRMRKPTEFNTDLNHGLIGIMSDAFEKGENPCLKIIPAKKLMEMKS